MPNRNIWDEGRGRKWSCSQDWKSTVGRRKPSQEEDHGGLPEAGRVCGESHRTHDLAKQGLITERRMLGWIPLSYSSCRSVCTEALNEFRLKKIINWGEANTFLLCD